MKREQQPRPRLQTLDLASQSSRPRASSMSAPQQDDSDELPAGIPIQMLRHRSVDSVQSSVEVHRSTSGRNLRLRMISQTGLEAMASPLALTPRAPPGKRGRRPRWEQSSAEDGDNNAKDVDEKSNGHDEYEEKKRPGAGQERRSSFSISPNAIKELERVRQMEKTDAMLRIDESLEVASVHTNDSADLEDDEDSSGSGDNHQDDDDDSQETEEEPSSMPTQQDDVIITESEPTYAFPLWNRAKKSARLPHALVIASKQSNNVDEAVGSVPDIDDGPPRRASRESESIQAAVEMVSMLHVDHSTFGLTTGSDSTVTEPATLSLTRSVSPRIGSSGSNFSFETSSLPLPTQPVGMAATPAPLPRTTNPITNWKRGDMVGAGTFGKVYVGFNGETGELFALKEIEIRAMPSADIVKQMHKLGEEIALMKNLSHKHIVRYKGSYRTDKHFCIFMEYVPGGSIASMLKQFDAFGEDLVRIFTRQIVQGVVYLHGVGVVHRDIKGANVLVNEQGMSKLADFGCSKQIPQLLTTSLEESLRSIRGSIPWMAPEVVKQERHGYKADVWSIGATVVEMATAKHPWPTCTNGLAAMYAIATATAPPPPPEHLSLEAKAFLRRCFCINPEERATAQELLQHPFLAER